MNGVRKKCGRLVDLKQVDVPIIGDTAAKETRSEGPTGPYGTS